MARLLERILISANANIGESEALVGRDLGEIEGVLIRHTVDTSGFRS